MTINELVQLFICYIFKTNPSPPCSSHPLPWIKDSPSDKRRQRDLQLNNQKVRTGEQGGGAESRGLFRRPGPSKNCEARGGQAHLTSIQLSMGLGWGGWDGGRRRRPNASDSALLGAPRTLSPSPLEDRINEPRRGSKEHVPTRMNPHPRRST